MISVIGHKLVSADVATATLSLLLCFGCSLENSKKYNTRSTHISVTTTIMISTIFFLLFVVFHDLCSIEVSKLEYPIFCSQPLTKLDIIVHTGKNGRMREDRRFDVIF